MAAPQGQYSTPQRQISVTQEQNAVSVAQVQYSTTQGQPRSAVQDVYHAAQIQNTMQGLYRALQGHSAATKGKPPPLYSGVQHRVQIAPGQYTTKQSQHYEAQLRANLTKNRAGGPQWCRQAESTREVSPHPAVPPGRTSQGTGFPSPPAVGHSSFPGQNGFGIFSKHTPSVAGTLAALARRGDVSYQDQARSGGVESATVLQVQSENQARQENSGSSGTKNLAESSRVAVSDWRMLPTAQQIAYLIKQRTELGGNESSTAGSTTVQATLFSNRYKIGHNSQQKQYVHKCIDLTRISPCVPITSASANSLSEANVSVTAQRTKDYGDCVGSEARVLNGTSIAHVERVQETSERDANATVDKRNLVIDSLLSNALDMPLNEGSSASDSSPSSFSTVGQRTLQQGREMAGEASRTPTSTAENVECSPSQYKETSYGSSVSQASKPKPTKTLAEVVSKIHAIALLREKEDMPSEASPLLVASDQQDVLTSLSQQSDSSEGTVRQKDIQRATLVSEDLQAGRDENQGTSKKLKRDVDDALSLLTATVVRACGSAVSTEQSFSGSKTHVLEPGEVSEERSDPQPKSAGQEACHTDFQEPSTVNSHALNQAMQARTNKAIENVIAKMFIAAAKEQRNAAALSVVHPEVENLPSVEASSDSAEEVAPVDPPQQGMVEGYGDNAQDKGPTRLLSLEAIQQPVDPPQRGMVEGYGDNAQDKGPTRLLSLEAIQQRTKSKAVREVLLKMLTAAAAQHKEVLLNSSLKQQMTFDDAEKASNDDSSSATSLSTLTSTVTTAPLLAIAPRQFTSSLTATDSRKDAQAQNLAKAVAQSAAEVRSKEDTPNHMEYQNPPRTQISDTVSPSSEERPCSTHTEQPLRQETLEMVSKNEGASAETNISGALPGGSTVSPPQYPERSEECLETASLMDSLESPEVPDPSAGALHPFTEVSLPYAEVPQSEAPACNSSLGPDSFDGVQVKTR